ncbi:MBL fold metallo-hydrolase [Chamaesiphon polymorphus]|uniref:MBL fold metallo-hydrolase n=1 Tax=Chamaesiphon polymorphus CCALA 037 TaxID=2107692 RepID=A0A2T1GI21_9CYAN|nr:MBL fold metallo-hydrolase [Chamaesiphon polymorphus]PSB57259.1 MBL fold metallo-hydrolase [Chamaesiphon polymorphus CCALA 037]
MAHVANRRSENIDGDLYVDNTCIDCDTCRWMAPTVFDRQGEMSAVYHQPIDPAERLQAMQALLSCPTASIGTINKPEDIKAAQSSIPLLVAENVYHCGYHAEDSYGAASYLIQHPDGNILVDSPRFTPPLVKQIEAMGGIKYLYLTHRDDVADHQKFHEHFGCDRILHQDEVNVDTRAVEHKLQGVDPIELTPELLIIPVPGHTKGHTVLLYKNKFLFSGDHLAFRRQLGHLGAFRDACWYSWSEQIKSMKALAEYDFEWVLPGHGRRYHGDVATMHEQMDLCVNWMATV